MVSIILNALLVFAFVFILFYIDRRVSFDFVSGDVFIIPIMLLVLETVLFAVIVFCTILFAGTVNNQLMKIVYVIDSIFTVTLSFGLVGLATNTKKLWFQITQIATIILAIVMVYLCYDSIDLLPDFSLEIVSPELFSGEAAEYFPWTRATLYNLIFKGILPGICYLFMVFIQEKKGSQLQRYQGLLIGLGLMLYWVTYLFLKFMSATEPYYESLFLYEYLVMLSAIVLAINTTTIPSGKGLFANFVKSLMSYVVPALIVGAVAMFLQPADGINFLYVLIVLGAGVVCILFSLTFSDIISYSTNLYSANYGPALEKDLASIDYSGEMDKVTSQMYEIFRRNVEASSVNVYILGSKGHLDVAYSSNNTTKSISLNNPIFDTLLNINRSIVCWSQVGNEHDFVEIEADLLKFFDDTKSDTLFILNEGHNIIGLITIGKKVSGDHYKQYDYNVFTNLYSYFFVFGYYMRNISNKDIIGTVNREIRMSSQIITSIQENIDHVKNPKLDTGYLMVPAHNIGGEFIDMIRLTDNRHLFVVGDLSGKGIAASMNMVILKSIIRTYLAETHDFKELVVKINRFIRDSLRKGTIFAGLFALIDFETDTMYYINCGIPALMLYTQVYNNVIEIQGSGHILGFVKDLAPFISVKSTKLSRGDIITACTDGLVQSHSLRGEQFGKERILQCILDNSTYPAQRMAQFTFDSLIKFMSKEMEDDVSILVMKYESSLEYADMDTVDSTLEATVDETPAEETPAAETPAAPVEEAAPEAPAVDAELNPGAAEAVDVDAEAMALIAAAQAEMAGGEAVEETVEAPAETPAAAETPVETPASDMPDLAAFGMDMDPEAMALIAAAQAEMAGDAPEVPVEETTSVEETPAEPAVEEPVSEAPSEEPAVEAAETAEDAIPGAADFEIPDDPDIPDLSNLDEMLKMAGL